MKIAAFLFLALWFGAPVFANKPAAGARESEAAGRAPDESQKALPAAREESEEEVPISKGLENVAKGMKEIQEDLSKGQIGKPVIAKEEKVVEEIDKLIARTSDEGGGGGKGGQQKPNPSENKGAPRPEQKEQKSQKPAPATSSASKPGGGKGETPGQLPPGGIRPESVPWGNLPYREREKIFEGVKDEFPAKYRGLLELYYKELAK